MKYVSTYESRRKIDDPFYHLAVALRDYLAENIDPRFNPQVKWYHSIVSIYGDQKFDGILLVKINSLYRMDDGEFTIGIENLELVPKRYSDEKYSAWNQVRDNMKKELLKEFGKFDVYKFYDDVYKFKKSIVPEMTEYFSMLASTKKYNL